LIHPTQPTRGSLVVDTSAAVAVILGEQGADELTTHLEDALARLMPAAIRVELGIVIEARLWPAGQDVVDRFLRDAKIDIVPVDADLAARAMSGWRRYGKGRHPARLNFGDCFTYALAERTGHPVLCTGDDFAKTGIAVVRSQSAPEPQLPCATGTLWTATQEGVSCSNGLAAFRSRVTCVFAGLHSGGSGRIKSPLLYH
jgi:ribonuclease VapC